MFSIFQPIIGCLLLWGIKILPKCSCNALKRCLLKQTVCNKHFSYIKIFLWQLEQDSASSLKKCPLLPGICYTACLLWKCYREVLMYENTVLKSDCQFYKWPSLKFKKKWEPWYKKRKTSKASHMSSMKNPACKK